MPREGRGEEGEGPGGADEVGFDAREIAMKRRRCIQCGKQKSLSAFYKIRPRLVKARNGYYSRCKPCYNKWTYRKRDRSPTEKSLARDLLRAAVRSGRIKKSDHCEICNKKLPVRKIEGHHWNGYSDPYDVLWLCRMCHMEKHSPPLQRGDRGRAVARELN